MQSQAGDTPVDQHRILTHFQVPALEHGPPPHHGKPRPAGRKWRISGKCHLKGKTRCGDHAL